MEVAQPNATTRIARRLVAIPPQAIVDLLKSHPASIGLNRAVVEPIALKHQIEGADLATVVGFLFQFFTSQPVDKNSHQTVADYLTKHARLSIAESKTISSKLESVIADAQLELQAFVHLATCVTHMVRIADCFYECEMSSFKAEFPDGTKPVSCKAFHVSLSLTDDQGEIEETRFVMLAEQIPALIKTLQNAAGELQ